MKKEVKTQNKIKKKNTKNIPKVKKEKSATKKTRKQTSFFDKILNFIIENIYDVIFVVLSTVALIIGNFAIGWKKALIIVAIVDLVIWFVPTISFIGNKTKRKFKRRTIAQIILWCMIAGLLAFIGLAAYIVIDAPEFNPNNLYAKEATIIYDKDGNIAAKIGDRMREKVSYEQLPEILIDAIIATEDSQFFEHNGFNPLRFARATISQLFNGDGGGASTITMQISKNAFTSFEASGWAGIQRKLTDIYLSIFKIEKMYTKEEILEFYVNSYYMGGGAWGVEQACQNYFGKSVSEINLSEAALLAGIFKGGGSYDPFKNPKNAEGRRGTVLNLMYQHGYITEEEKNIAMDLTVDDIVVKKNTTESYQAFIDTVVEEVRRKTNQDPYSVPMEIYTTMDTKKQEHINKIMNGETFNWENDVVQAGIAVTDTNTGAIVAVGAGRNKTKALTFNYATSIDRQIGSTAKPLYDYAPAIEYNNLSPAQPIADEPYAYSDGTGIRNWDRKYEGLTTIRQALKVSRNIPALKTFQSVKNSNIKSFVTKLGLDPEIQNGRLYETHAIGGYNGESPLSMAAAYAAFANGGTYIEPYSFTKIIFRETNEEFINTYESRRVMSNATAYLVTSMLIDTAAYTTGSNRINGIQYTNKTGTTNLDSATKDKYNLPSDAINDLWCAGYSRDYAVALWYGYDHLSSEYYNVSKGQNTKLYKAVLKGVLSGTKDFKAPSSIVEVPVEIGTSEIKKPSAFTPEEYIKIEYFKDGTQPTEESTRFAQLPDVNSVDVVENNSTITLSWNPINQPNELNADYLTKEFSKNFTDAEALNTFVTERLVENATLLGNIEYEVYIKNADDTLTLLGTTDSTTFQYTPTNLKNGSINFVVKTTYSIFKNNASKGAETGININKIESVITSNIQGATTINLQIGASYQEPIKPVSVYENLTLDVTEQANITKTITDSSGNVVDYISTATAGTYTITYRVEYKEHHNTLTKTIIVQ